MNNGVIIISNYESKLDKEYNDQDVAITNYKKLYYSVLFKTHTYHMCENPFKPSNACSGLVNTVLNNVSFPWLVTQMPGCRGVPFFSGNHVEITPMGLKVRTSSADVLAVALSPDAVSLHVGHCHVLTSLCMFSISFWWLKPNDLTCCLNIGETYNVHK